MSGHFSQPVSGQIQASEAALSGDRIRAGDHKSIEELINHASSCRLCRLCYDRTQVVNGYGAANAELFFISDAPGYHDDKTGHLLSSGVSGEVFDQLLSIVGESRESVRLTSVVRCRPANGRSPFPDEIEACEGWLFREIALVKPQFIVTLGTLALRLITGRNENMRDVHGTLLHTQVQGRDVCVWPLYHPAAAAQVEQLKAELYDDTRSLNQLLQSTRKPPSANSYNPNKHVEGSKDMADTDTDMRDNQQLTLEV